MQNARKEGMNETPAYSLYTRNRDNGLFNCTTDTNVGQRCCPWNEVVLHFCIFFFFFSRRSWERQSGRRRSRSEWSTSRVSRGMSGNGCTELIQYNTDNPDSTVKPRYNEPCFNKIPAIARWTCYLNYFPIQITRIPATMSLLKFPFFSHTNLAIMGGFIS